VVEHWTFPFRKNLSLGGYQGENAKKGWGHFSPTHRSGSTTKKNREKNGKTEDYTQENFMMTRRETSLARGGGGINTKVFSKEERDRILCSMNPEYSGSDEF